MKLRYAAYREDGLQVDILQKEVVLCIFAEYFEIAVEIYINMKPKNTIFIHPVIRNTYLITDFWDRYVSRVK